MNEVFTFIDATHVISKGQLWKERDELIKRKYEKMNNDNVSKVASDREARFGCKGGDKFWFGYKEHVSVDAQSGMINKVAVTKANVTDAQGMRHVCPRGRAGGDLRRQRILYQSCADSGCNQRLLSCGHKTQQHEGQKS
jgi:IS5 family transposase